jgi:hypothetical protein
VINPERLEIGSRRDEGVEELRDRSHVGRDARAPPNALAKLQRNI